MSSLQTPTPAWYVQLVELSALIQSDNWEAIHDKAKELNMLLFSKAPTVTQDFENVVLLTMDPSKAGENKEKIKNSYHKAVAAADKELDATDFDRIMSEEQLADRLDVLSEHVNSSLRIIWNYWWGEKSGDYKEWEQIKKDIKATPLTYQGRLRLLARHETIGQRILPSFAKMIVQLWPIAAIWVIKKVATFVLSQTVTKAMEARKAKKQLKSMQSKVKDFNLASVSRLRKPTESRKRKRRRKRR